MSAVSEIMSHKGVVTLRANFEPTVLDAVKIMLKNKVGSVVIVDSAGKPEGIITERDILRTVSRSKNKMASDMLAGEIMSSPVITVKSMDSVDTAASKMAKNKVKRLVVVESDGKMAGIISVSDITKRLSKILSDDYNRYRALGPALSLP
jgi:CBS domain-containing protein